jgi:hypothetical protein
MLPCWCQELIENISGYIQLGRGNVFQPITTFSETRGAMQLLTDMLDPLKVVVNLGIVSSSSSFLKLHIKP